MPAVHFSDRDFEEKVLKSSVPVMVDFYAEWCGPCKMAAPVVDKLAEKYQGKVMVGKMDVDQNNETAIKYGVMSIPTVVLFKDGREVVRKVGFAGEKMYEDLLEQAVN